MVFPFKTDGGAVDGDASFAFLRQKIQDGVAIVHRSYGSGQGMAGVMKNAFAEGGFAGVDVGQNANVAYFVHGIEASLGMSSAALGGTCGTCGTACKLIIIFITKLIQQGGQVERSSGQFRRILKRERYVCRNYTVISSSPAPHFMAAE